MISDSSLSIIFTTLLVETSPQALPLGAACVASSVKSKCSAICDIHLKPFSLEDDDLSKVALSKRGFIISDNLEKFADEECKKDTIVFCFSIYMWNHKELVEAAYELKKRHPNAIFICGGPEVTARPEQFSNYGCFDFSVSGEGEDALLKIISKIIITSRSEKEPYTQLLFGKQSAPDNLTSPYLDGTLDPSLYGGALWELARGCPYKCSYCYESKGGKKVVYFPEERLKKELDLFVQKKIGQVFVLDPTYNADQKRALRILNYIAKKAPDIYFYFECRAELVDRALAKAFSRLNCSLQIGLQSAHPGVLKLVHRSLDKKKFVRNVGFLNESGAIFGFDLIYGLPGDSLLGFEQSIDFALSLYPNHLELFLLSVLPGTDLYDRAQELNLIFLEEPPYHVISSPTFSAEDLKKAQKLSVACNTFYSKGRAVPWFNSLLHLLKMKAHRFFWQFADFSQLRGEYSHREIEKMQIGFIKMLFKKNKLEKYSRTVCDIIAINGAFSRAEGEKLSSKLDLQYHPNDLLSAYSQDIVFFVQQAQRYPCCVEVYFGKNGVDFRFLKTNY